MTIQAMNAFGLANKPFNKKEVSTGIMNRIQWANERSILPVHIEDENLHEYMARSFDVLGRPPKPSGSPPTRAADEAKLTK